MATSKLDLKFGRRDVVRIRWLFLDSFPVMDEKLDCFREKFTGKHLGACIINIQSVASLVISKKDGILILA